MPLKVLHIEKEEYTPLIQYIPEENKLVIEGKSISEDPLTFFAPLFEWTQDYINDSSPLTIHFNLEYFNTTSSKMIFDFVKNINEGKVKPDYIWKYLEEDEDVEDFGEYLKELIGDNFKLESYED